VKPTPGSIRGSPGLDGGRVDQDAVSVEGEDAPGADVSSGEVPPAGPGGGRAANRRVLTNPAGLGSCGDANGTAPSAYRDFWCPSAGTDVSAYREYELSVVTPASAPKSQTPGIGRPKTPAVRGLYLAMDRLRG